jgi:lipoprotein-releasing system permease protein
MLPLQIAYRFLRSSLGQTISIVLGISVGVSVQVFIGSLIGGLQDSLVQTTIGNSSQITIVQEENITDYQSIREDIIDIDGVETVAYALDIPGSIIIDENSTPILLRGFELNLSEDIYELQEKLVEGEYPSEPNEIAIGIDMFEDLSLSVGDTVTIDIPLVGSEIVTISGVYDFNVAQINTLWIISDLNTVQTILGVPGEVSKIEMQVNDVFEAVNIATLVTETIGTEYEVTNWIDQNQELLSGLQAQGSSSLMIQVFVTISVVLGISSVLAITVIQKSKQIGILKAMGIKDRTASFIFLSQGFLLGILGAIGGVLLGLLLTYMFSTFALDPDGNPVVPLLIEPTFIMISAFVAIISASVASIIPARKSSKVSIIEVIKNG